jgi:hypothetical protein
MIIFGSVRFGFYKKKVTKPIKKKPKPVQTNRFQFGLVFRIKTGSNRVGSVFFRFGSFISVWVRFGFFGFRLIKPKPNRLIFLKF